MCIHLHRLWHVDETQHRCEQNSRSNCPRTCNGGLRKGLDICDCSSGNASGLYIMMYGYIYSIFTSVILYEFY